MKVVFWGTPEFVLPVPIGLVEAGHELVGVVTGPARAAGRGRDVVETAVARWGKKKGFLVLAPESLDREVETKMVKLFKNVDVVVVAAYGKIVPKKLLGFCKWGFLNVHPSLLPAFRGASPVAGAIVAGEEKTGVSIMKMDEKMDHGPVGWQKEVKIDFDITREKLRKKLFEEGTKGLVEFLGKMIKGKVVFGEQEHKRASYTRLMIKEDGSLKKEWLVAAMRGREVEEKTTPPPLVNVEMEIEPLLLYNLARGLCPWPGVWTRARIKGKERRLKILEAGFEGNRLVLKKVQLEGKKPVSWKQFREGYPEVLSYST